MTRMSTGWRRALVLGLTTVVGAIAVAGPGTSLAQTPTPGGSIVTAIEGEPTSVDPAFDYDFVSGLATSSITEPLLVFCEDDAKLCPNLATEWTVSPDGLTYTLKIRQGVKFHDGTPMTVEDVVYSMDRVRDPALGSYVGWMLANVADITAPDAETVVITLSEPDALFEYALASTAAHVVNKAFVEANGDKYGTPAVGSIGTGPFKFVEWVSGDHQTLARNDDYWNKANGGPYLDTVTIKILPEPTTRVAGLDTGEIDYLINNVPSDQFATVDCDGQRVAVIPALVLRRVDHLQHAEPPFDNVKVRQALNYALDKKAIRQLYYGPDTPDTKATLVYPDDVDVRAARRGRRHGTRSRPTTRTSTRRVSCWRSRASPTSSTARPSPTTSRRRRSRASASRSSTPCPSWASRSRPRR